MIKRKWHGKWFHLIGERLIIQDLSQDDTKIQRNLGVHLRKYFGRYLVQACFKSQVHMITNSASEPNTVCCYTRLGCL